MPFVLSKKPTFRYAVRVKQARESGRLEIFEFMGEFKRLDQPAIREQMKTLKSDRDLLDAVWVGWSGVKCLVERDGVQVEEDMPVTPQNREALLAEPGVEAALVNAWMEAAVLGPAKN